MDLGSKAFEKFAGDLKKQIDEFRNSVIDECAAQADAADDEDQRDNGIAATGAAVNAARKIRGLRT